VFQACCPERPSPRALRRGHLNAARTRFESIAERKLRRRQLTRTATSRSAASVDVPAPADEGFRRPRERYDAEAALRVRKRHRICIGGDCPPRQALSVSRFGRGEGLRGDRPSMPPTPVATNASTCGLCVRAFPRSTMKSTAECEVKRTQLPARLLAQPRDGGLSVLRLCHPPLMYSWGKADHA